MLDIKRTEELQEAIELMYFAYRSFTNEPDSVLSQRGLGRVHHRILYFVGRNSGITVSALLEILQVSKQALHTPLRQLIHQDLIESSIPDHDRRLRELSLTTAGKKLEKKLTNTQMILLDSAFRTLPDTVEQEWKQVMQALMRTSNCTDQLPTTPQHMQ